MRLQDTGYFYCVSVDNLLDKNVVKCKLTSFLNF